MVRKEGKSNGQFSRGPFHRSDRASEQWGQKVKHGMLGFAQYLKKDCRAAGKDFLSKYDKMHLSHAEL